MPYRDPAKRRAYDMQRKRLQRAGCPTQRPTLVPVEFRLKTAVDVLHVLEEQVAAVRSAIRLKVMPKATGQLLRGSQKEPRGNAPTLGQMHVGKKESFEAQLLAEVPESEFRAEVAKLRVAGKRPTRKAKAVACQPLCRLSELAALYAALERFCSRIKISTTVLLRAWFPGTVVDEIHDTLRDAKGAVEAHASLCSNGCESVDVITTKIADALWQIWERDTDAALRRPGSGLPESPVALGHARCGARR